MMEEKTAMRLHLESVLDQLYGKFEEAYKQYTEDTEDRLKSFMDLKQKDEKSCKEIDRQMKKLSYLSDTIATLKQRLNQNQEESDVRIRALREEKEKMLIHLQVLKQQIHEQRTQHNEKLKKMTAITKDVKNQIKEAEKLGEKILKLFSICCKYETEEESIIPFYKTTLTKDELQAVEEAMQKPCSTELAEVRLCFALHYANYSFYISVVTNVLHSLVASSSQ